MIHVSALVWIEHEYILRANSSGISFEIVIHYRQILMRFNVHMPDLIQM